MPKIKSGIFIMPYHDPAKPLAQSYDEGMELVIRADELEFETAAHLRDQVMDLRKLLAEAGD